MNASALRLLESLARLSGDLNRLTQLARIDADGERRVDALQLRLMQVTVRFAEWATSREPDVDHLTAEIEGIARSAQAARVLGETGIAGVLRQISARLLDALNRIESASAVGDGFTAGRATRGGLPDIARHEPPPTPAASKAPAARARRPRREPRPKRYANVELREPGTALRLDPGAPLKAGQVVLLRLNIGKLTKDSLVRRRKAFPDDKLPKDIDLDVMVSSTDFGVGSATDPKPSSSAAHGRLFLPGKGGPAIAPDGTTHLSFRLRAPDRAGPARSRVGYYYKNILVQSQLVTAQVGEGGGYSIETDFTLSDDLTSLQVVPQRPRLSILTNSNGNGTHQIVLRLPGAGPGEAHAAETYGVDEKVVGELVGKLRATLTERAPTTKQRRRAEFEADLRQLAPHGWDLYAKLPGQRTHMFMPLLEDPEGLVVQVLRPTSSSFTFPWAFVYEIPLLSPKPDLCPLVANWDGKQPLVTGLPRECPHGPHKENVLCPFGFWGFRYAIEQLSSTDKVEVAIHPEEPFRFAVAQTQYDVDLAALDAHVDSLRATLMQAFPGGTLEEGKDKAAIRSLLGRDLPLVYFYCHGERQNLADANTWLGVGKREALPAQEFIGWIVAWQRDKQVVWDKVRPLVFVNACHSLALYPNTFVSYLDAFVTTAHAAGVIGTEVKVHQGLAMDVARQFFELLLSRQSVESALRRIRLDYLAAGNLFGLVYTPYCWSELRIN